jgi:hypothetical protein
MPCFQIITNSVEFQVKNIELLKRALTKIGWTFSGTIIEGKQYVRNESGRYDDIVIINFDNNTISNTNSYYDAKSLSTLSNKFKRAYSEEVLNEVAKKNRWMLKKQNENNFSLNRL